MTFEKFLQKWFGLQGELRQPDEIRKEVYKQDDFDVADLYTKKGWASWEKAIDLVDALENSGVISSEVASDIITKFTLWAEGYEL